MLINLEPCGITSVGSFGNPPTRTALLVAVRAVVLRGRVFDWATWQALRDQSRATLRLRVEAAVAR